MKKKKKNNINGGFRVIDNRDGAKFKFNKKKISIHFLSDFHLGSHFCDKEFLKYAIKKIKNDKDAYIIGVGDYIEYVPPNYHYSQREQNMEGEEQVSDFIKLMQPVADKILFLTGGNHDADRSIRIAGIDIVQVMSEHLNVPYYQLGGYTKISVGNKNFLGAVSHGCKAVQNPIKEHLDMKNLYSNCDYYVLGHSHELFVKEYDSLDYDDTEHAIETLFIRSGSFLKYAPYARKKFYKIVKTGWVELIFDSNGNISYKIHKKNKR